MSEAVSQGRVEGAAPVRFDPFEPGFVESPYAQYARLRADDPVHHSDLLEGWVLTRYDDVNTLLRDPTVSSDLDNASPTPLVEAQRERQRQTGRQSDTLVLRDEPDHSRLRKLLQKPFGPRQVERLRQMVSQRVDDAMADLLPRGAMDVVADFAYPLPVSVFCEMLGFPDDDSPQIRDWVQAVARGLDPVLDAAERQRVDELTEELYSYLEDQIEVKRAAPTDDVLTELVHAEEDGDRLTRSELVAQLITLYVAGHEPITALVGNGLLALLRQPEQLALLQDQPELLGNAIQELLRYDGPNQFVRRVATRPLVMGGKEIAPGDVIYPGVGAANRDPARWDDPDAVHVDRPDASQHLQFGTGIHHCLGTHLARLTAEIALGAVLTRLDDLALAGEPIWNDRMVLRAVGSLPITYTPA
jgi:cytochrome P450